MVHLIGFIRVLVLASFTIGGAAVTPIALNGGGSANIHSEAQLAASAETATDMVADAEGKAKAGLQAAGQLAAQGAFAAAQQTDVSISTGGFTGSFSTEGGSVGVAGRGRLEGDVTAQSSLEGEFEGSTTSDGASTEASADVEASVEATVAVSLPEPPPPPSASVESTAEAALEATSWLGIR